MHAMHEIDARQVEVTKAISNTYSNLAGLWNQIIKRSVEFQ
jgi:hypothetical protein